MTKIVDSEHMGKRLLRIWFADFWEGFDPAESVFMQVLTERYDVQLTQQQPDFIFYSVFGNQHHKYTCPRVFYTGENRRPNWKECDFALTFDYIDHPRHFRFPHYAFHYGDVRQLLHRDESPEAVLRRKTKFCCCVVTNPMGKERNAFFRALSRYKQVDSGGQWNNNVGGPVADKMAFIKDYKFVLAFENSSYPGYTTEKIFQPMLVRSLPIYWGSPLVHLDFNTRSFINCHDFASFEEVIERIIAIDQDDELYLQYLSEPNFTDNVVNAYADKDNLRAFLFRVVQELPHLSLFTRTQRQTKGLFVLTTKYAYRSAKNFYRSLHS